MRPNRRWIAAASFAALLIAGCGDSGDAPAVATPETPVEQPADDARETSSRPDGFPAEMPLPDGAFFAMRLPDATAMHFEGNPSGVLYAFDFAVPIEQLQATMEAALADAGWTITDTVTFIAAEGDVAWRVSGHGLEAAVEVGPYDDGDSAYIAYIIFE